MLSTLDTLAWRYNIPEALYPEALIPGRREIGTRTGLNLWGNVYRTHPVSDAGADRNGQRRVRWIWMSSLRFSTPSSVRA
ncbi:hypothetical protein [Azospirillum brasilense]|uniref:hypothetical protein n=1 Tax=Azospirillum brasilense TaxID=192 RepID=UPI003D7C50D4